MTNDEIGYAVACVVSGLVCLVSPFVLWCC